jgi:thioredoxin-related protein
MTRPVALLVLAAILAWAPLAAGPARAAEALVHARNFKADGRLAAQKRIPILVVFTSPGCHFCQRVKAEYLLPMQKDPAYKNKVLIRELEVGSQNPLTLFDGSASTEGAFAADQRVFMVPTLKFFDPQGREISEPIVGLLTPDYYFGYIDAAITEGLTKIRATARQ